LSSVSPNDAVSGRFAFGAGKTDQNAGVSKKPPKPEDPPDVWTPCLKHPKTGQKFPDDQFLGNDRVGDCTCAMHGHYVNYVDWLCGTGDGFLVNANDALDMYEWVASWNGVIGSGSDDGAFLEQTHQYMARFGLKGKKLLQSVRVIWPDYVIKLAIYGFLQISFGLVVPETALQQYRAGQPWTLTNKKSPIIGGHAITGIGYDKDFVYVMTWGRLMPMSYDFIEFYGFEALMTCDPRQAETPMWKGATDQDLNAQWQYYTGFNEEPWTRTPFTNDLKYKDPTGGAGASGGKGGGR
jgi:hypothetical protein